MAEQTIPLDQYGSVTLDANGQGTVTLGPAKPNERWEIQSVAVSVSSNTNEPMAKCYRDIVSQTALIGGTYSGSFDYDSAFNYTVFPGRKLVVQWTGGDIGATASVRISGNDVFTR